MRAALIAAALTLAACGYGAPSSPKEPKVEIKAAAPAAEAEPADTAVAAQSQAPAATVEVH